MSEGKQSPKDADLERALQLALLGGKDGADALRALTKLLVRKGYGEGLVLEEDYQKVEERARVTEERLGRLERLVVAQTRLHPRQLGESDPFPLFSLMPQSRLTENRSVFEDAYTEYLRQQIVRSASYEAQQIHSFPFDLDKPATPKESTPRGSFRELERKIKGMPMHMVYMEGVPKEPPTEAAPPVPTTFVPPPYLANLPVPAEMDEEWVWACDLGAGVILAMYIAPDGTPTFAIDHDEAPSIALALSRALSSVVSATQDALEYGGDLALLRERRNTLQMWSEEALKG